MLLTASLLGGTGCVSDKEQPSYVFPPPQVSLYSETAYNSPEHLYEALTNNISGVTKQKKAVRSYTDNDSWNLNAKGTLETIQLSNMLQKKAYDAFTSQHESNSKHLWAYYAMKGYYTLVNDLTIDVLLQQAKEHQKLEILVFDPIVNENQYHKYVLTFQDGGVKYFDKPFHIEPRTITIEHYLCNPKNSGMKDTLVDMTQETIKIVGKDTPFKQVLGNYRDVYW
ncbi:MAG: hypothetical protein QW594_03060 [Candidatus Woesearchaeota archaeon]